MVNTTTRHALRRRLPLFVFAAAGVLAAGCVTKNDDDCIFRGGDFGFDELDVICIAPREEATEMFGNDAGYLRLASGTRAVGELPVGAIPDSYVWARFGVPRRVGELGADDGLETMVGVLDRARQERGLDCAFDSGALASIAEEVGAEFVAFHDAVNKGRRRSEVGDTRLPIEGMEAMNRRLEGLLADCERDNSPGSDTEMSGTTGQDTGLTTDGPTTTDGDPCTVSADCGGGPTPYCNPARECVPCNSRGVPDDFCGQQSADTPVCAARGCVACSAEDTSVCDADLLVCDDLGGECVPCIEHAQCEAGACDIFEGRCFDPLSVVHAGQGQRFLSINAALDAAQGDAVPGAVLILHGGDVFVDAVETTTDGAIAFVGNPGRRPVWTQEDSQGPILNINDPGARVYLDGIELSMNAASRGVSCTESRVDIRRSRIVANTGGGIRVRAGCQLRLETSYVGANGSRGPDSSGLFVDGGSVDVLYATIADNTVGGSGNPDSIVCVDDAIVSVRNSIVVGRDAASIACLGIQIETSAVDEPIEDNVNVGPADLDWFEDGDFGLTKDGAMVFEGIAVWEPGDPVLDIDGDARPAGPNRMDYVGADVP